MSTSIAGSLESRRRAAWYSRTPTEPSGAGLVGAHDVVRRAAPTEMGALEVLGEQQQRFRDPAPRRRRPPGEMYGCTCGPRSTRRVLCTCSSETFSYGGAASPGGAARGSTSPREAYAVVHGRRVVPGASPRMSTGGNGSMSGAQACSKSMHDMRESIDVDRCTEARAPWRPPPGRTSSSPGRPGDDVHRPRHPCRPSPTNSSPTSPTSRSRRGSAHLHRRDVRGPRRDVRGMYGGPAGMYGGCTGAPRGLRRDVRGMYGSPARASPGCTGARREILQDVRGLRRDVRGPREGFAGMYGGPARASPGCTRRRKGSLRPSGAGLESPSRR